MLELSKGQLHPSGALARRKAALPQVLVLQPRNTRTPAHTHTPQFAQGGVGWEEIWVMRVRAGVRAQRGMIQGNRLILVYMCLRVSACTYRWM